MLVFSHNVYRLLFLLNVVEVVLVEIVHRYGCLGAAGSASQLLLAEFFKRPDGVVVYAYHVLLRCTLSEVVLDDIAV